MAGDNQTIPEIRTMAQFSAYVGLSRPTVSKYFNSPASVRKKTRKRIEQAVSISGFHSNIFAVTLKRQRTKFLGVIIPNSADPFYMELTRRIEDIGDDAGYLAVVLSSKGRVEIEAEAIERLQSMNIAGTIVAPLGRDTGQLKLASMAGRVPLICVNSPGHDDHPFAR